MKIAYDNIIFSLQSAGGISVYWSEIIKRLVRKKNELTFFESKNINIFRKELNFKIQRESSLHISILRYLPFLTKLPPQIIFHSSYYRVSFQRNVANITTVHDFTYEYFRNGLARIIHIWQKKIALNRSDGIICISENTKKDLMKFYPMIRESKIKVVYNGVGDEFIQLENPKEYLIDEFEILKDKKYILYIGDRSSYKNFDIAIEVLKKLYDYSFVVVGGQEFSVSENKNMKDINNKIYHFRGLSGCDLNILYNNAFCLLYPSSYEGFGIPIVEAMKAGCPVLSTNTSSIPEVAGNASCLVKKIEANSFVQEVKKLENNDFRNDLINQGLIQSKNFSWDKCFNETYNFYQEVWGKKFGD